MSRKRSHKFQEGSFQQPEASTKPISHEALGLLILAITTASFLSLLSFSYVPHSSNWLGNMGHMMGKTWFALLGLGTYPALAVMAWIGWRILFQKPLGQINKKICYAMLCIAAINLILCVVEDTLPTLREWLSEAFLPQMWHKRLRFHLGGASFYFIYRDLPRLNLLSLFNTLGVCILATGMLGFGLLSLSKLTPQELVQALAKFYQQSLTWMKAKFSFAHPEPGPPLMAIEAVVPSSESIPQKFPARSRPQRLLMAISMNRKASVTPEEIIEENDICELPSDEDKRSQAIQAQKIYNGDFQEYALPPADLLTPAKPIDSAQLDEILRHQAEILEETLMNFGIVGKVGNINCGPTITSFEIHPAVGVKVQRIKALENDIALNLEAKSIRIIAPIPGKAAVGIEVPSPFPQEVSFQELLLAYQKGAKRYAIPILLGKAVNGDSVMSDLAKMPHLIIAGATGSGKSVCINTIVMSIVLNAKPDEIRLIMVDPKKVELTAYSPLPHMLAPVITEPSGACAALQWMVKEMESRYELLKQLGLRNIDSFNSRTRDLEKEASLNREVPDKFYYVVGIIDELADLMMVSSNEIETYIARIAQMARAVGIHLILATQRPSREVITGLIKANFPTRISFKVASRINSQIILDETGAETLLGNGDMLFLPPGTSTLMRAQGAYIRDDDINRVIRKICDQAPTRYVIDSFDTFHFQENNAEEDEAPTDSLFAQAKDIVLNTGNASTTFLQRKLKIGYARAASLMDQLERFGIVGPAEGSKPRKILNKRRLNDDNDALDEEEIEV